MGAALVLRSCFGETKGKGCFKVKQKVTKKRQNKNGKDEFSLPFCTFFENNCLHFVDFFEKS